MYNKRQTARFCSQLKTMLSSGMPLLEALAVIKDLAGNKKSHHQLEGVVSKINGGYLLSEAGAGLLPPLAIGSLRAAERAGNLEETLESLSRYYESKADLEEKILSSLAYPCFVLLLSLLSLLALIFFVLPGLKGLFADLGADLPPFTSLVLGSCDLLSQFWYVLFLLPAAGWLFIRRMKQEKIENYLLRAPLIGKIIRQEQVIQGFGTLGALLSGGTPILESLTITAESSRSNVFKQAIMEARDGVENGESLSREFSKCGFFPGETIQMLGVGESSGRLAEMLLNIADFQAKERESALKRFTTLLEPAMTLAVGVMVGFVVLAMFLPLVNMISSLQ